jgi:hypothetical protein
MADHSLLKSLSKPNASLSYREREALLHRIENTAFAPQISTAQ